MVVMRVLRQFLVVLGAGALAAGSPAALAAGGARLAVAAGGWGKAIMLPGGAGADALSCPSPGNCGAGGSRPAGGGGSVAFVASQVHGRWGRVLAVPGLRGGKEPESSVSAVSCPSVGNCVAVGGYLGPSSHHDAFIVAQRRGAWGKAAAVPGLASLDKGNDAGLSQVSCPSIGNCSAIGTYSPQPGATLWFTVSEVHGIWGNAAAVPLVTALPGQLEGSSAGIGLISCSTPGNCGAAGSYQVNGGNQLFVISQAHGVWGNAIQIPETAALNTGLEASVNSISCPSPGNCSAGGYYWTSSQFQDAFVVDQVGGTWHRAIEVRGAARFGGQAWVSSISCPSAGNCGAGGIYNYENTERPFGSVFVVNEVHGTWYRSLPVPGTPRLNNGDDAAVSSISCTNAWNCGAGGYYTPGNAEAFPYWDAFVVREVRGTWDQAIEVPGTNAENTGVNASITTISCAAPGLWCTASGYLLNNKTGTHDFLVSTP
jgi:hypothetical protein